MLRRNFDQIAVLRLCSVGVTSEVGGGNRNGAEDPTRNPSPAPTRPHRTHDTTDQWREIVLVASPILEKMSSVAVPLASNVQYTGKVHEGAFCHTSKLILTILESMESPWSKMLIKPLEFQCFCDL